MYSAREVATVLGVPSARLRSYLRAGCVNPERDENGELRFSFRDLVLLRKAELLVGKSIPPRRVARALRNLRDAVGEERPLSGFDFDADGAVVVVEEGRRWCPDSRQMLLDFERAGDGTPESPRRPQREQASVAPLALAREGQARTNHDGPPGHLPGKDGSLAKLLAGTKPGALGANEHFERGCSLEDEDPNEARAAYRAAIDLDPDHADAHVNLGRLLHEAGHPEAAQVHYRVALSVRPEDPTASFNLGVALEDMGQKDEAIRAYQVSITCDPANADAHYNLARLLEQTGKPDLAIRHLLIYRQLTRRPR